MISKFVLTMFPGRATLALHWTTKGKVGTVGMGLLGGCKDILFEKMSEQIEKRNEIEQLMTDESEDEKKEEEEETEENKKRREDR